MSAEPPPNPCRPQDCPPSVLPLVMPTLAKRRIMAVISSVKDSSVAIYRQPAPPHWYRLGPQTSAHHPADRHQDTRVPVEDGSLLGQLTLDANRDYQPRGVRVGRPKIVRDVVRHASTMSCDITRVPRKGIEPLRPYEHSALNAACLPVPPPRRDARRWYQRPRALPTEWATAAATQRCRRTGRTPARWKASARPAWAP